METEKLLNRNANSSKRLHFSNDYEFNKEVRNRGNDFSVTAKKLSSMQNHIVENGEATELIKLRSRGPITNLRSYTDESHSAPPANVVYLERDILPNDTLQSFALLYGCTLNDLKRLNNLINEQDYFALRRIKIPVKKHGLLTEPEEEMKRRHVATTSLMSSGDLTSSSLHLQNVKQKSFQPSFNDVYHTSSDEFTENGEMESFHLLHSNSTALGKESTVDHNDTSKYLKSVDKEIRNTLKNSEHIDCESNEVLDEVVSSLGSVGYRSMPLPTSTVKEGDGEHWGVKWSTVFIFFIVCLIVIFILVGVRYYFADNHKSSNSSSTEVDKSS